MSSDGAILYLSHPLTGHGLRGSFGDMETNQGRVGLLAEGIAALHRPASVRVPVVGAPGRVRRILGDEEATALGPFRPPGAWWPMATEVWVVGPDCTEVRGDVELATAAGIAVVTVGPVEQDVFLRAAVSIRRRRDRAEIDRLVAQVIADELDRPDFTGARAVASAWALSDVLGVQALDYGRMSQRASSGGETMRSRLERISLRMARAAGIVRRARLTPEEQLAVRLRDAEDRTWRQVAECLGWADDEAAAKRASRLMSRAMGKITEALRSDERRRPGQGPEAEEGVA